MTPEGSVYGQETRDWDGMMARLQSLDKDYPLKGLRPIGAAGPRGDGYSACYLTGQMMANLATKDMKEWEEAAKDGNDDKKGGDE